MKRKNKISRLKPLRALLGAAPLVAGMTAIADDGAMMEEPPPFVSGTLSLMVDTHFISYGADVWGAGGKWDDLLFHPSLELGFDLGKGFKGILGTWWDVNDNATTSIGPEAVQEVDVWVGLGYSYEEWSFTVLYQEWLYASQSERIVDFKVGYSHWLNPSFTLHSRVDNGFDDDINGIVAVLGVAPGKELGPVSFSFPLNVAFNTDEFHGGDAGLTFISAGVSASIPLTFIPRGDWSFTMGVTFYHTPDDTIPGNPCENFVTGTSGISLSF